LFGGCPYMPFGVVANGAGHLRKSDGLPRESQNGTSPFLVVLAGIGISRIDVSLVTFQCKRRFGEFFAAVVDTAVALTCHPVLGNQFEICWLSALPDDEGVAAQFLAGLDFTHEGAVFGSPKAGVATPAC